MKNKANWLLAILLGAGISSAYASFEAPSPECKALKGTELGTARIVKAEPVTEGDWQVGFFKRMLLKIMVPSFPDIKAEADFCRVTAKLHPVPDSEITAELWLPKDWNGKLLGVGGSGFNGGISGTALALNNPLGKGYAGLATDAGHEDGETAEFAYKSEEKLIDYAYRANNVAAEFAKDFLLQYYGKPVTKAYFNGCSNGGRDGLMLAARYPTQYDGIVAGAPAANYTQLSMTFAWHQLAARQAPGLKDKLKLVNTAVMNKCDELDGLEDGILENPLLCQFDPQELLCGPGVDRGCLTANEVDALKKIYSGPRLSDGTQVSPGLTLGGEALPGNWDDWVLDDKPIAAELFRWFVYGDPEWDLTKFDIDTDYVNAKERMGPILDGDNPELTEYFDRGGKLIMFHGWNDGGIPSEMSIEYFDKVHNVVGDTAKNHFRLFMVPGMTHCAGGVGATTFNMFEQLEAWVEGGEAPERVIASEYDGDAFFGAPPDAKVLRTHPLCAWPEIAIYSGHGSPNDASSFTCGPQPQAIPDETPSVQSHVVEVTGNDS